jgi:hypothetical protein
VITSHAINHAVILLYSGQVGYVAVDLANVPMLLVDLVIPSSCRVETMQSVVSVISTFCHLVTFVVLKV